MMGSKGSHDVPQIAELLGKPLALIVTAAAAICTERLGYSGFNNRCARRCELRGLGHMRNVQASR